MIIGLLRRVEDKHKLNSPNTSIVLSFLFCFLVTVSVVFDKGKSIFTGEIQKYPWIAPRYSDS